MASDRGDVSHRIASAGFLIFAKSKEKVSAFYQEVLKLGVTLSDAEHDVLSSEDTQLIVHKTPTTIANQINISNPPSPRESTALKFFLSVPSLSRARIVVGEQGGRIVDKEWQGLGFMACDVCDPEGNIFQLREVLEIS